MRITLQRVSQASCRVNGMLTGEIDRGLLILVGFTHGDDGSLLPLAAKKCLEMRIFPDSEGKLNLSLKDIKGSILLISQFTLYANCRRGRRPDFTPAAAPDVAKALYDELIQEFTRQGFAPQTGIFGADMQLSLINDGPITINLEWDKPA